MKNMDLTDNSRRAYRSLCGILKDDMCKNGEFYEQQNRTAN